MFATKGYATHGADQPLKPFSFERRDPTPRDVQIEILFCGICHSDLHIARNEFGGTTYPCVPGHEIVGRVVKVGREAKKFKEGDRGRLPGRHLPELPELRRKFGAGPAIKRSLLIIVRTNTPAALLTAAIPRASWWTRILCYGFGQEKCRGGRAIAVRGSRLTRRFDIGS